MTTGEQNEREEFEQWLSNGCASDEIRRQMLCKLGNGEYKSQITFSGYKGWQAAWQHQQKRIDEVIASAYEASQKYEQYCELAESKIKSLQAQLNVAVEALDKLQRLGNEPCIGNSIGNSIATEALNTINKMKGE